MCTSTWGLDFLNLFLLSTPSNTSLHHAILLISSHLYSSEAKSCRVLFLSLSLSPLLSLPSVSLSTSLSLSRNPQRDLRTYMHGCRNLVPLMVAGAKLFLTLFTVFYPLLPALPLTPTPGTRGGGWPIQTFGGRRRGWEGGAKDQLLGEANFYF